MNIEPNYKKRLEIQQHKL